MPPRLLFAAICLTLPACWVPIEQGQAMESDIVKMKSELADQRRVLDENAAREERERAVLAREQASTMARVDAKIQEVTEALAKLNHAARKTGADLAVELSDALTEVARLRGLLEEVQAKQTALEEADSRLKAELDAKLVELDLKVKTQTEAVKAEQTAQQPTSKEGHYGLAREKLERNEHDAARKLFASFIEKWPGDPLAANSQYWLGESFYGQKKYREAILEFRKVNEKYPKSDKAPDALLKIGYAFVALGLKDEARLFLDEVVRSHPKSPAAKLAKTKLTELK